MGNSKASPSTRSLRAPRCQRQHPPGTTATASSSQALPAAPEQIHRVVLGTRPTEQPGCLNPANALLPSLSMLLKTLGNKASLTWNEKQLHVVLAPTPVHLSKRKYLFPSELIPVRVLPSQQAFTPGEIHFPLSSSQSSNSDRCL